MERAINQRIKFLLESFQVSARDFSRAVGVPDNNTQNYLEPRFAQPKADYLEKVLLHFESINPSWLLTGKGEPFLPDSSLSQPANETNTKIFSPSQHIGKNSGKAEQHVGTGTEKLQTELALAQKEIESLRAQLAMKDQLLAAKDETIGVFRAASRNPN